MNKMILHFLGRKCCDYYLISLGDDLNKKGAFHRPMYMLSVYKAMLQHSKGTLAFFYSETAIKGHNF